MNEPTVTLDVRPDIRSGVHPLGRILEAAQALQPGQALHLIAPFKPAPLLEMLARQGFVCNAEPLGDSGDWQVAFTRAEAPKAPSMATPAPGPGPCGCVELEAALVEVDTRGLEPPQPMMKILEALSGLPAEAQLRAFTDRRPMHLYAQLQERGFAGHTEEQPDGSCVTWIHRA